MDDVIRPKSTMAKLGKLVRSIKGGVSETERAVLRYARQATPLFRASATARQKCEALCLSTVHTEKALWEPIYEAIRAATGGDQQEKRLCVRKLQRHLWLRALCDGLPAKRALELLDIVRDATNQDGATLPQIGEATPWQKAFSLASTYRETDAPSIWHSSPSPEIRILAEAVQLLRKEGYRIRIVNGEPDSADSDVALASEIDTLVSEYGGIALAEWIFARIRETYEPQFGRYVIVPALSSYPTGHEAPMIPFGYLLNLAAKHAHQYGQPDQQKLHRIVALSTSFAVLFDVQPYFLTEGLFNDRATILKYLRQTAAFDSLFTFPQSNPRNVRKRLIGMLEPVAEKGYIESDFGVTLTDLASLAEAVLESASQGPSVVSSIAVSQKTGLPIDSVASVLNMLSCDEVNGRFLGPLSTPESNLHCSPLITTSLGYLVLDPSLSAPAFIEAALGILRKDPSRQIDKIVGLSGLENYVRRELLAKQCHPASGRYDSPSMGESDCDCLVE